MTRNGHSIRRFMPAEDALLLELEAEGKGASEIGRALGRAPKLSTVEAETKANDPAALKAELARLRKELTTIAAASNEEAKSYVPDPQALEAARKDGFDDAVLQIGEKLRQAIGVVQPTIEEARSRARDLLTEATAAIELNAILPLQTELAERIGAAVAELRDLWVPAAGNEARRRGPVPNPVHKTPAPLHKSPSPVHRPSGTPQQAGSAEGDGLPPARRKILVALRQLEAIGKRDPEKLQVALFAGASHRSSSFTNNLGALRSAGLIDYPAGGRVALTPAGAALAPAEPPKSHADLMAFVEGLIPPAQFRIVQWLAGLYPEAATKAELADAVGASLTSSSFTNNLGRLRSLGLIDYPRQGAAKAAEVLFP